MKLYFLDDDLSGTWTTYSGSVPTAHLRRDIVCGRRPSGKKHDKSCLSHQIHELKD